MQIAQYFVGFLIVMGLAVPLGMMAFGVDGSGKAATAIVTAPGQISATRNALKNRSSSGSSSWAKKARQRDRAARARMSPSDYRHWKASGVDRTRTVRVRFKKVRIQPR